MAWVELQHRGQRVRVEVPGDAFIGRAPDARLRLTDAAASRWHARLRVEDGRLWIEPVDGAVRIDGRLVETHEEARCRQRWLFTELEHAEVLEVGTEGDASEPTQRGVIFAREGADVRVSRGRRTVLVRNLRADILLVLMAAPGRRFAWPDVARPVWKLLGREPDESAFNRQISDLRADLEAVDADRHVRRRTRMIWLELERGDLVR